MTAYDQDKFCGAAELCEANLALRDVKNIATATEAITVSCSLARSNRVSCAVHCYVIQRAVSSATAVRWFCRWNRALLCVTAGCVKCHSCLFVGSAGGTVHCCVLQQDV